MYTIIAAVLIYLHIYCYLITQIRAGRIESQSPDGSRMAMVLLLGYPLSVALAAIVASTWISQSVPFLPVMETYALQPLGTAESGPNAYIQARGYQSNPTAYLVRYQDGQGRVTIESIGMSSDVKVFEDVGPGGTAVLKKTHQVRDVNATSYKWALFDDGDVIKYSYNIHVPKGSIEVRLETK